MALLFLLVQLGHTLFDQNNWPFCSYNVFSRVRPLQSQTLKARLYEEDGSLRLVNVWELLPLEFFRAISVIQKVYIEGNNQEAQTQLAQYILHTLNTSPWNNFDQTYPSARPTSRFVGMEILRVEVDLHTPKEELGEETIVFSYR